ncbi:hypothetical protein LTR37_000887 [Vermiconidia calcicola]|uniref:Uncharacterized protein n=1 Tax=Vermiconidia calcicola TaxID=1690605 RepID=A0ACC3NXQ2_9PEZI|nr:hypothetical protein LTR37_000887 [Vermiconidia calcicola]
MSDSNPVRHDASDEVTDDWDAESDVSDEVTHVAKPSEAGTPSAVNEELHDSDSDDGDDEDSDSTNDDGNEEDHDYTSQVLNSYRGLLSRRVDLVGDYAGNELFMIDGDSMLLRCFADDRLDFDHGFQMLHAAYNVEQFLHHLTRRKCNFHVVFFDSNKTLCIPPTASNGNATKYLLARAAIIRHLQMYLPTPETTITIHDFPSYTSPDFTDYLTLHSPYFVMAHDGADAGSRKAKHLKEDQISKSGIGSRAALREMVLFFIERGFNVALVNGLEWRDTKVMAMVLERRHRAAEAPKARGTLVPTIAAERGDDEVKEHIKNLQASAPKLTERQVLAALAISRIIRTEPAPIQLARSFIVHQAVLAHIPLSARRLALDAEQGNSQTSFLQTMATCAESILQGRAWRESVPKVTCDLADFLDGHALACAVKHLSGMDVCASGAEAVATKSGSNGTANGIGSSTDCSTSMAVMPFSNPVFDKHLASVHLQIDDSVAGEQTVNSHRVFREVTHWHNAKKPLIQRGPPSAQSEKQAFWAAKRNQMFMAEMQKYAASLTNAVGRSLEPESIIVGATKPTLALPHSSSGRDTPDSDSADSTSSAKSKQQPKKGGKKAQQSAGKQAIFNQIAETKAKKEEATSGKIVAAWHTVCKGFESESNDRSRYRKAQAYLASLPSASRNIVAAECESYMLSCLLHYWVEVCRKGDKDRNLEITALIWSTAQEVYDSPGLTKEIAACVDQTINTLALPPISSKPAESLPSRKPVFTFAKLRKEDDISVVIDPKEFQLRFCGPYLERSFDSRPDHRVDFQPDGWQRRVLDSIDADKSVFAVAPTSAGKTFISFYAMRKVLEADDDGILVYVAPTKALVNQIAAEIQARYSKKFKYGGKSVWAIHTRDYRINNPTGCQVLVTVPHVLQIMLLAPTNANAWSSRVKRIIFDEVHSIGQAEDGVVWEQLLLLAPCPIIALSATVGNPGEFSDWLATTQKAIGIDLDTVQHPHRYSDLRKYYYVPPKQFAFQGLPEKSAFGTLGLEHAVGLNHIHPVAALTDRSRDIPVDLALEPRDCLELYNALAKHANDAYPISPELIPKSALPDICKKVDILRWERELKAILQKWIRDSNSPYVHVIEELERSFRDQTREHLQATRPDATVPPMKTKVDTSNEVLQWTLSLLCRLNERSALPAILFNYDRFECERVCQTVVEQLQAAEEQQVKSGPKWEKKLEKWEEWKKVQEKLASKGAKVAKKKAGKGGEGNDVDDEKTSKLEQQKDAAGADASAWEFFNPEAPIDGYHFADHARVLPSEMGVYVRQLRRREVQAWLINALERGIGVHHAGMNRKYRQVVEILFRKGFLRVVVATGTLALGINMPCKTVVFSGDSVFLTALNYRQCAGRAGRRGFDLLGNVVFQGVSREKVCRLISSRLPDLNGHFPITTTLVLRLFTLLHESKNSKYAASAINALLSQPRLYMGGPSFKDQTMHHLRFSIEYLRRQYLLGSNGAPLNFAGLVSHLYFTENSSFAFHALLKEGYFHELCAGINKNEKNTLETLMLVMAHLFNRTFCRQADEEYKEKVVKPSSSIVFLPPLPKKAATILRTHNAETLDVYRTYVETFVDQHITSDDRKLPLTGMEVGTASDTAADKLNVVHSLPATKTRSSFVAISGHGDRYSSIADLCETTRDGVFLEQAVIPYVGVEADQPLNAWLLDFFKHGDVRTLERANGIRRSDIWFMLNDFSLVLATLIAALMGYMKLKESTDMDMLDVMGNLDAHEEAEDEQAAASEEQSDAQSVADSAVSLPERPKQVVSKKKAKNADSWEDVADEEDAITRKEDRKTNLANEAKAIDAEGGAWGGEEGGEGLKNVLKAFTKLHAEFTVKFRAMWA